MWKSYYEGRWVKLAWETLQVSHGQYGFSWWDSVRISVHAARAALYFRKNSDDPRCLPALVSYYEIIRKSVNTNLDTARAAELELTWWKQRRQNQPPRSYGQTIAELAAVVFRVPIESVLDASILRAEAMAYRDARRNTKMSDADWEEIGAQLERAYAKLVERLECTQ